MPAFVSNDEALAAGAELVFCCLDHERAAALEPPADAVVVDLSGAHRLAEPALYPAWYGFEHPHAGRRSALELRDPGALPAEGPLIANPGCYATAVLLALAPLADVDRAEPASSSTRSRASRARGGR